MKKILFISHEATRTGAPLLLLQFLQWLKQNTQQEFSILLMYRGEMEDEFAKLGNLYILEPPIIQPLRLRQQIVNALFKRKNKDSVIEYTENIFKKIEHEKFSLVYGNTIISISVIQRLIKTILPNAKYIVHVHEMQSMLMYFEETIKELKNNPIHYIVVSDLVKNIFVTKYLLSPEYVNRVYGFIDYNNIEKYSRQKEVDSENYLIQCSGAVLSRKGYDIFIYIAKRAIQKYPNIPFMFKWIGKYSIESKSFIDIDIQNAGLQNRVEFVGAIKNPFEVYSNADLFLLTSREDPFPLVVLEHACLGIPTVCFKDATGIVEFIKEDAGVSVPYLDIEKMVDVIAELYFDKDKRIKMGQNAKQKIQQYDIEIQVPKIFNEIIKKIKH